MTIANALWEATQKLAATSDTARLDAELLMAEALQLSRSDMLLRGQAEAWAVPDRFDEFLNRRMQHEPIAYILGRQEFYGRDFVVTPDVLIPRADSETAIRAALEEKDGAIRVLDCGTGSGALLISYLLENPLAKGVGIDCSQAALKIAESNARRHGLKQETAQFHLADWSKTGWADDLGQFDLILANPPYVETGASLDPTVQNYEPHLALFAGEDGMDDYRFLIPQLRRLIRSDGLAVVEIGSNQAQQISILSKHNEFTISLYSDLADRPRCVILR